MLDLVSGKDPELAVSRGVRDVVWKLENSIAVIVPWEEGDGVDVVGLTFLNSLGTIWPLMALNLVVSY